MIEIIKAKGQEKTEIKKIVKDYYAEANEKVVDIDIYKDKDMNHWMIDVITISNHLAKKSTFEYSIESGFKFFRFQGIL